MGRSIIRARSSTRRNTNPAWERWLRELRAAGPLTLKVGYLGDGGQLEGGFTAPQLAALLTYGTADGRIPPRPHVGPAFDANRAKYERMLAQLLLRSFRGQVSLREALGLLGAVMASDIRAFVASPPGVTPPNAESTLRRKLARTRPGAKGSPLPLIDTGRLLGSITWAVSSE